VGLQPTEPTADDATLGVFAAKLAIDLGGRAFGGEVAEGTVHEIIQARQSNLFLLLQTVDRLSSLVVQKAKDLLAGEAGLTATPVHALELVP
jgi:hypothetical protein